MSLLYFINIAFHLTSLWLCKFLSSSFWFHLPDWYFCLIRKLFAYWLIIQGYVSYYVSFLCLPKQEFINMTVLKSSLEYEIFAVITPMCVFVCHGQWSVVEHLGNNICLLTGYFVVLMSQEHFLRFNLQLICSIIFLKKGLFKSLSLIFLHSFSGQFQFP